MKRINFCVILYNKEISESNTVTSLIDYFQSYKILGSIVIFNNGPKKVEEIIKDYIICNQVLVNVSLSKIYNKFIDEYPADYYVFLDDDTFLNYAFLHELENSNSDILFPLISCKNSIHYPVIRGNKIQTITSGLTLSSKNIENLKLIDKKIFDERFDLYGIDTAFCYMVNKNKLNYTISKSIINHDLSHITSNCNEFREIEVLLSNSASLLPYFNFQLLLVVCYGQLKMLSKFKLNIFVSSFFSIILKRVIRIWRF